MTVEAGELVVRIVGNASGLQRDVESKVGRATQSVTKMGRSIGLAFGGAAVIGGITKTLNLAKNFDLTMRQVGVQTDQTGAKLGQLSDLALKMGQDTVYSAQDAAAAMLELAKGGLTAAQIKAGALETSMTLAAAGGLELADASRAVVNGMGAFNLRAGQASRVATALAGAANASSADVSDMTQALAQASAQASATGLSIEETSAALAIFANNGVKGSDAGTSLKTMLQNLLPTTVKQAATMKELGLSFVDAHGKFVNLESIAGRLHKSLDGLTQAQRMQALRTLFGSDASRAALFLYKAGADGVRKMTKATSDSSTVQKMAKTTMEGASGAWENFTGSVETAAIRVGTKALPALTALLNWGSDALAGADQWGPTLENAFDGVRDSAEALWPVVKAGADLVKTLAETFGDLPGPVQSSIVQAGLIAMVLPRITAGVTSVTSSVTMNIARLQQWRAEMTYSATRAQNTAAMMQRLGGAARAAAGIGGLLALTNASKITNDTLSGAAKVAGDAAVGFSVGGPWGGAIGGTVGLFHQLWSTLTDTGEHLAAAKQPVQDYASSLDQITGAATRATRATILLGLQQRGATGDARELGISNRDLVSYMMGNKGAIDRVTDAMRHSGKQVVTYQDGLGNWRTTTIRGSAAANDLRAALGAVGNDMDKQADKVRANALVTEKLSKVYKGVPRNVITRIRAVGGDVSLGELRKLARQVNLTPKTVRIIARANNLDLTRRQVKHLADALQQTEPAGKRAAKGLEGVNKAKPDLSAFNRTLLAEMVAPKQTAATGGKQTGNALGQGIYGGVDAWAGPIASRAAAIVNAAVAAAKHAGEIKSPSAKMAREVGKPLGEGVAKGLDASHAKVVASAKAIVDKVRDQYKGLLQDSRAYGRDLANNLVGGADITAALPDNTAVTTASILAQFKQRVGAADAFTDNLGKLDKRHLPKALLDQLRDAGVEQGGATATALAGASESELRQIRSLQKQLQADAKRYADGVTQDKYGDRIAATRRRLQRAETVYDHSRHVNNIKVDVHNPVPEKASETVPRKLRRLAQAGAFD